MTALPAGTAQLLQAYADAKNRHDVDAIVSTYAPDGLYRSVGFGAPVAGHEALRAFYTALFAALPDYSGDFDGMAIDGATAVVWGRFGGTTSGSFMGIEVQAGRRLDIPVSFVCTFRDGRLVSDVGYFDAATLCDQAGISLGALRGEPTEQDDAARFVEGFADFWADPRDTERVRELITPDAVLHWPGAAEPLEGQDAYVEQLANAVALIGNLQLRVVAHAGHGETLIIAWEGSGTVAGRSLRWNGFDRFRLRGAKTAETTVVFDTQPVLAALAEAAAIQPSR